mmetsp:Transcript_104717/g.291653  ORF Transcript_104717/g.291653 Transcript_104717/m.291653 type:complete len:222 (+) Transcript_104717:209-874(+)
MNAPHQADEPLVIIIDGVITPQKGVAQHPLPPRHVHDTYAWLAPVLDVWSLAPFPEERELFEVSCVAGARYLLLASQDVIVRGQGVRHHLPIAVHELDAHLGHFLETFAIVVCGDLCKQLFNLTSRPGHQRGACVHHCRADAVGPVITEVQRFPVHDDVLHGHPPLGRTLELVPMHRAVRRNVLGLNAAEGQAASPVCVLGEVHAQDVPGQDFRSLQLVHH